MNRNKIALISCWAALISGIGAAVSYTVYGPDVPLPYIYVPPTQAETEMSVASEINDATEPAQPEEAPKEQEQNLSSEMASEEALVPTTTEEEDNSPPIEMNTESDGEDDADGTDDKPVEEEAPENLEIAESDTQDHVTPEEESDGKDEQDKASMEEPDPSDKSPGIITPVEEASETKAEDHPPTPSEPIPASEASTETETEEEVPSEVETEAEPEVASLTPSAPQYDNLFSSKPSWELYRQPPPAADGRPRIAIVLTGLGLSRAATEAAIRQLPSTITLSFTPYAKNLESWIALARSQNHEVMLDLPMEPLTYPTDDPGPQALLTGREPEGNLNNLSWIASRGSGYIGMSAYMGDRFITSKRQMTPVMKYFKDQGLMFLDNGRNKASLAISLGSEFGVPVAINHRAIDEAQLSRTAIDSRLAQVERIAIKNGFAIATGRPYPVTLERIANWVNDIEQRGFQLIPITAVIDSEEPITEHETEDKDDENHG